MPPDALQLPSIPGRPLDKDLQVIINRDMTIMSSMETCPRDRRARRIMADVCAWMVRNRHLCHSMKCLLGLLAARLRYSSLRHRSLETELLAAARRMDLEAEAAEGGLARERG
jgi:hypothetical protein